MPQHALVDIGENAKLFGRDNRQPHWTYDAERARNERAERGVDGKPFRTVGMRADKRADAKWVHDFTPHENGFRRLTLFERTQEKRRRMR